MSTDECCQDRTRCSDNNRGSNCVIVCGSHRKAHSGPVFLGPLLLSRETERYSPGGWRSQRALLAQRCGDALVRELGVSPCPPGRMCCWAGGQKENHQGLKKTYHVIENDSGASSGGNQLDPDCVNQVLNWWMLESYSWHELTCKHTSLISFKHKVGH